MIKNIIFDMGGVLLDVDVNLTYKKLGEVMGLNIDSNRIPAHIYKLILGYEKGEINTETFLWNLQKESSNLTPQPNKLIKAWNAMLIGWKSERFNFLQKLKKSYNLYLLSNSNDLHLEWIHKDLKKVHGISDFDTKFFNQTFYSHLRKMRKPENQMFRKMIELTEINPAESLFIDNSKENVSKAREVGLNAVLHDPKDEIIHTFDLYLREHQA